jgi:two-component system NtrC family response regulator/two-component system nitrogen regulation response regulator GlnG
MARILVIDDDAGVRATVTTMLRSAGHEVVEAVDGEHGIKQFLQKTCDAVLCDVFMPKKSGIGTLRALRKLDNKLPIVMMSGGAPARGSSRAEFVDYLALARMYGATETMAKPFRAAELFAVVERALRASARS